MNVKKLISTAKSRAIKLGYVLLGAIIGISYYIAYTEHAKLLDEFANISTAHAHVSKIDAQGEFSPKTDKVSIQNETPAETIVRVCKEEGFNDPELLVKIAKCESSLNPKARSKVSSAKGLFQILDMHQLTVEERENPEIATRWAVKKIQSGGLSAWNASKHCWDK